MVSVKMGRMPATVVLLHGFAGTGRAWDAVIARLDAERYNALAPDLRGHGAARDARPISFDAVAADVLAAAPARFVLCGYSMGGRIALHVARRAPARVERLVLVATTVWREDLLRNDPRALAAVLRGLGTGAMAPLWDRLGELTMPATVLVGADDAKFVALAQRLTH